ncbi:MAG TPA: isoleucine--tRNA ligase [Beijerinckiaceae bacterium]|nr:isoleucine--tRNA ligase [Beijerinckiaceae bacterium]
MTDTAKDYSQTLFLPETAFPMRAGLPAMEPKILERWVRNDLYGQLRASAAGRPKFVLHDGPPYANGHIHIGHALNKILKDMVTRAQQMSGFDSNYVPGWDCHGLPIEWKIEEEYRAKGREKPDFSDGTAINAFRKECRSFAEHWLTVQREEFKRLGVIGDWDNPYSTMAFHAEAQIAREIMKFAENGLLYRGSKPVMWSVVEKTALAEAEVEYHDHQSDTVYVAFPVAFAPDRELDLLVKIYHGAALERGRNVTETVIRSELQSCKLTDCSVVIWTTTPWTLPGNRAIAYSHRLSYGIYEVSQLLEGSYAKIGTRFMVADNLAGELFEKMKAESIRLRDVVAYELDAVRCTHPLAEFHPFYAALKLPLLDGDHVTDDAGTGFVHTAPGHGREDFDLWMAAKSKLEAPLVASARIDTTIPYTVDEDGAFTRDAPGFTGERVLTDKGEKGGANEAVIKALIGTGTLVARGRLKHQYPHSWRSKKPVIFRNTPQWFIAMDREFVPASSSPLAGEGREGGGSTSAAPGSATPLTNSPPQGGRGNSLSLRAVALDAIRQTQWVPAAGENRITGMIENRPDWVVSRQRAWGVPITVFVHKKSGEILKDAAVNVRIAEAFEKEGADAWFADKTGARFLGPSHDPADFDKVSDVLDVWFDSGSTHSYVLNTPKHFPGLADVHRKVDGGADTVMYLEGSDQHRGWFHSSLLESCGTRGRAPFDVVLTHGFCLDEKGQKMSKSLGNVVAPQAVIKESGADILRLWVAASDYSDDLRIGEHILKNFVETYRKMRNTLRWMLGSLAHFRPDQAVAHGDMPELERLMLHRLAELDAEVRPAYAAFDYKKVVAVLAQFMNTELSAFYFDIRKDTLYCDPASSKARRAALTVIDRLFETLTVWLAPILSFTAEEAWLARHGDSPQVSVHLQQFPALPAAWQDAVLAAKWDKVRAVRRVVTGALEIERAQKRIGSSLEAAPQVFITDAALSEAVHGVDMAEVAITSGLTIIDSEGPDDAFRLAEVAGVSVVPARAGGIKCARSWKYFDPASADPAYPDVTGRDAAALREWAARAGQ